MSIKIKMQMKIKKKILQKLLLMLLKELKEDQMQKAFAQDYRTTMKIKAYVLMAYHLFRTIAVSNKI